MDITKVTFNELKSSSITSSFEDLDVNGDGVINNNDLKATKDTKIAKQLKTLLNSQDSDAELKTGATKNKYGVMQTDSSNFENDVTNSKGTVYVILGNLQGCSYCVKLEKELQSRLAEVENVAAVYNIEWKSNSKLCWNIYKQGAQSTSNATFPQIAKFVDGKFVELISNPRNVTSAVQSMIDKAEGTKGTSSTNNTKTGTVATKAKTDAEIETRAKELLSKYPVSGKSTGNSYSMSNPELVAFKKAIDDGILQTLSDEGFSKNDIIKVIAKAFPTIGIKANDKGGYTCPYGHGDEAKALYNTFTKQLAGVTSETVKALQAKVAELNDEIRANNLQLKKLKTSIETIKTQVEEAITEALKKAEEIKEEQKEEAASIVKEELNKYTNSNGEMTYETFQSNLASKLDTLEGDGNHKLSNICQKLMDAESRMYTLKKYVSKMGTLVTANKTLSDKVAEVKEEAKKAAASADGDDDADRCDPIGFSVGDVQYDFFVDKDNDGKLSNEQEFLGAENSWAEMTALDTNKDGKVTKDEMKNLKIITTDKDCNQTVVNASDLFKDTDSINLSSYKSVNQDMSSGNTLLGTYSLTFDGKEVTNGYNTLDKLSWLDANYNFSDEENGINRFAKDNTEADDVIDYSEQYNQFTTDINTLDTKLTSAWSAINIFRNDVQNGITSGTQKSAEAEASEIEAIFKKHGNCGASQS